MIAIEILNSTSHYVAFLKIVFKLHFDKTKLVYYPFFVNNHKPYANPISFTFTILRLVCVHAHVKTLCARVCVFDWSKKGCGRSNAHRCVTGKKYFEQCGTNAIERGKKLWTYPLICLAQL